MRDRRIVLSMSFVLIGAIARDEVRAQAVPAGSPASAQPANPARVVPVAGRVVDGLDRPIAGVTVRVLVDPPGGMQPARVIRDDVIVQAPATQVPVATVTTNADGRFAGSITAPGELIRLDFVKEGYEVISGPATVAEDRTMRRLFNRSTVYELTLARGNDRDRGLRELLASAEWADADKKIRRDLFKYQADLRPSARRLVGDRIVGPAAKGWLESLADPADTDLVAPKPHQEPIPAIREGDLVEAIRATARRVNWFSSRLEPVITMGPITFTPGLDRALVECGINLGPFTGVFWHFVFHREEKRWLLRSMTETGRG